MSQYRKDKKDDYVIILDYLPEGKAELTPYRKKPIAQAIGDKYFTIIEIAPRQGHSFDIGERVYIGSEKRDKVDHIERRIRYEWLTPNAKSELPVILVNIVKSNEAGFLRFYNTAGFLTPRQHQFERLPGVGKKISLALIHERAKSPFKSFDDMHQRIKGMHDPAEIIADKIVRELSGESKYIFFLMRERDKKVVRDRRHRRDF